MIAGECTIDLFKNQMERGGAMVWMLILFALTLCFYLIILSWIDLTTGLLPDGLKYFKEFVLPTIREEMKASDRNIYHLDGPGALRHLDAILEVPEIHAIQWVYGAGNGPARNWLPVYKKILDAGKGIRVEAEDYEDIRILNEELGSKGVWYAANFSAPDVEAANRIVNLLAKR